MKKITLLFVAIALVFMSCDSNDDDNSNDDPIIGTWKYFKYIENGVEQQLDLCETEDTLIFTENGNLTSMDYEEELNACVLDFTFNATWSSSGNIYTVNSEEGTDSVEITFDGNTFYTEDTYSDGIEEITYREVYIKQ